MLALVPVKARNSIDITSTRETTKTRATTPPSNSLKLSFTAVVDSSLYLFLKASVSLRSGRLAGAYGVLELVGLPYQSRREVVL
jgi:hypothetical protein